MPSWEWQDAMANGTTSRFHGTLAGTLVAASVLSFGLVGGGCSGSGMPAEKLTAPRALVAPYNAESEVLWAVAPLRNESGTRVAEMDELTDSLIHAAEEVRGIRAVPYNRTMQAMRALKIDVIETPGDARRVAEAMGVDGILVGTLTAYDPYTPTVGLSVALFGSPGAMGQKAAAVDPREITRAVTAGDLSNGGGLVRWSDTPLATASQHMDGKNQEVLLDLRAFAEGRTRNTSALGWRRYTASMPLYCEFASFRVMDELLRQEWVRAGRSDTERYASVPETDGTGTESGH